MDLWASVYHLVDLNGSRARDVNMKCVMASAGSNPSKWKCPHRHTCCLCLCSPAGDATDGALGDGTEMAEVGHRGKDAEDHCPAPGSMSLIPGIPWCEGLMFTIDTASESSLIARSQSKPGFHSCNCGQDGRGGI